MILRVLPGSNGVSVISVPVCRKDSITEDIRSGRVFSSTDPMEEVMLEPSQIEQIADELVEAAASRVPVKRLSARFPAMTIEDSYAVQALWHTRREAAGRTLVGRKIGLTSRAMQ